MSTASDNTAKWAVRKFGGAGLPVGFEYFTTNPNISAGSLPLLGGVYSRTLYKDLWNWVQEQTGYLIEESEWQEKSAANGGNVPFYSTGDGITTFRVPSLKCWVKGTDGSTQLVGSYLEAGLPNITGGFGLRPVDGGLNVTWAEEKGAVKITKRDGDVSACVPRSSSQDALMSVSIDASRSSAIYGNSDTVQPKSIVGMWLVKAYGTVTNVGSADVSNIAQGLTELENRVIPIEKGGTGATNANDACNNLGLSWDYLHRYGTNFVPNDTSNHGWNNLGVFSSYYTETNKIKNQPTRYGQLLNIPANKSEESTQIWIEQANGRIYFRGGNASIALDDTPFKKVVTTEDGVAFMPNYGSYVQISTGDYTPTSNGIIIVKHTHNGDYQTVKVVHKSSGLEIFRDTQARYPGDFTSWCLVAKSETYTISVSGGSSTVYFCPMKEGKL